MCVAVICQAAIAQHDTYDSMNDVTPCAHTAHMTLPVCVILPKTKSLHACTLSLDLLTLIMLIPESLSTI